MKRLLTSLPIALIAAVTLSVPANAQEPKEKTKEKEKDRSQIVITQSGDKDEKLVIEFKGDKVLINGKEAEEFKSENVNVRRNKVREHRATRSYNMNFDDHMGFYTEDQNRAMLGVTTEKVDKGAQIEEITKESGAEKAGLKKGDIITRINETKIEDADGLTKAIRSHKPGDKVTVSILRDGKEQKITAELGKYKGYSFNQNWEGPNIDFDVPRVFEAPRAPSGVYWYGGSPRLGLSVQDTDDGKGVKVIEVDEESNAAKAGIKEDDIITHINDKAVNSADEISKQVKALKTSPSMMVKLTRGGKVHNIEVKIPRKLKTADL